MVLTAAERTHLLTQGYLNLGPLITPAQCEEAKRRILAQVATEETPEWTKGEVREATDKGFRGLT